VSRYGLWATLLLVAVVFLRVRARGR
jgi:hypothetical protein